jgi:hypothetical protein
MVRIEAGRENRPNDPGKAPIFGCCGHIEVQIEWGAFSNRNKRDNAYKYTIEIDSRH